MEQGKRIRDSLLKTVGLLVFFLWCTAVECRADLKSSDVLKNSQWTLLTEYEVGDNTSNLQAMCCTDNYIVCLVNASNEEPLPDTLVAFYKGTTDENGNEVRRYSVARTVRQMDYEHGNGMAYNPNTREIVIAGGKNLNPDNKGCVFIIDADTLRFKRKVKVSDNWNVHAIDYSVTNDNYLVQKGGAGGYHFVEADLNFHITAELKHMVSMGEAGTFQDLCVCGDDIISLPYNKNNSYNGNIQVYSRKEGKLLGEYRLSLASDSKVVEAESISELSPGSFVLGCALRKPRRIALYGATLPMTYRVTTAAEHASITESTEDIDLGSDFTVSYTPIENYEVREIKVDGAPVNVWEHREDYTFASLTRDHSIWVRCTEIPKFEIFTEAVHGTIDGAQTVYRDKDVTVHFAPDEHYELESMVVDGKEAVPDKDQTSVTFRKIKGPHQVSVVYKEIPAYIVTAQARHGTVSSRASRVYRDEDHTVSFKPDRDYILKELYVDGIRLTDPIDEEAFTFANIQRRHDLVVVYVWKYTVLFRILTGMLLVVVTGYLVLTVKRRRKRRKYREERNRIMR